VIHDSVTQFTGRAPEQNAVKLRFRCATTSPHHS